MNSIAIGDTLTISNGVVNERLNEDSQKVLFPKKLEKANKFWKKAGIPDNLLFEDTSQKLIPTMESSHISSLVQQTRLQRNLTIDDLAHLVGVENKTIMDLENQADNISFPIILKVFHVLNAELTFVVTLSQ